MELLIAMLSKDLAGREMLSQLILLQPTEFWHSIVCLCGFIISNKLLGLCK